MNIEHMENGEVIIEMLRAQSRLTDGDYAAEHGCPATYADARRLDAFEIELLIRLGDKCESERMSPVAPDSIPDDVLLEMFSGVDFSGIIKKVEQNHWFDDLKTATGELEITYDDCGNVYLGPTAGEYYGTNVGRILEFIKRLHIVCGLEVPTALSYRLNNAAA